MKNVMLGLLAIGAIAGTANAGIVGVVGDIEFVAAPADARLNVYTSKIVRAWNEQQDHTLVQRLRVNAVTSKLYDANADLEEAFIAAGTRVASHYIHFDTPGGERGSAKGLVRFDADILGVICVGDSGTQRFLDASDFLSSGTIYPDAINNRGLELGDDSFRILADRRTVEFNFQIASPGDYMRVVTAVPTPGSAALLGIAGLVSLRRRR
jgi:MYXO-CTERM domain-containing protein